MRATFLLCVKLALSISVLAQVAETSASLTQTCPYSRTVIQPRCLRQFGEFHSTSNFGGIPRLEDSYHPSKVTEFQDTKLHIGDDESKKHIHELINNCVWKKAIMVDGELYWATGKAGEIGEPVTGQFKFKHYVKYWLLAPVDNKDDDPVAEKDEIHEWVHPEMS
jgi:hypothetical protein